MVDRRTNENGCSSVTIPLLSELKQGKRTKTDTEVFPNVGKCIRFEIGVEERKTTGIGVVPQGRSQESHRGRTYRDRD